MILLQQMAFDVAQHEIAKRAESLGLTVNWAR